MNDLMDVRDALGQPEPPSQAAYSAARAALLHQAATARAPGLVPAETPRAHAARTGWLRQRRTGWLAGGLGLTAAAAAVAVAVATGPAGAPKATRGPVATGWLHVNAQAVSRMSARQILLDAATTAASKPAVIGKYWYVKQTGPGPAAKTTTQDWYTHNGTDYHLSPNRNVVYRAGGSGFSVGASSLTYQQIQHLPTNPAALTAWIIRSFHHPSAPPLPHRLPHAVYSPPPRSEVPGMVASSLGNLLGQNPAPPALRAAAFRALAALPDVTKVGQVDGGVVLRVTFPKPPANKWPGGRRPPGTGQMKLTIGTSTLTLRAWSNYQGTTTLLAARWTNHRPPLVSVNKAFPAKARKA